MPSMFPPDTADTTPNTEVTMPMIHVCVVNWSLSVGTNTPKVLYTPSQIKLPAKYIRIRKQPRQVNSSLPVVHVFSAMAVAVAQKYMPRPLVAVDVKL